MGTTVEVKNQKIRRNRGDEAIETKGLDNDPGNKSFLRESG